MPVTGGVALNVGGNLVIRGCSIINNNSGGPGGGIMLGGNSSIIHNTMIHNNAGGSGIYVENTALDMKGCTLSNNVSGVGGGLYIKNVTGEDLVEIKSTIIENNAATSGHGGGI